MSIFSTYDEYEEECNILKERLKVRLRSVFNEVRIACYHGVFNDFEQIFSNSKSDFMAFTKDTHEEWCNKTSLIFETSFDSVLYVVFTKDKYIEIETLELFIDDFFDKCHVFDDILDEILDPILIEESMHIV